MDTTTQNTSNGASAAMPDAYDRQLAQLHGLPDVTRTSVSTLRHVPPLGIGGTAVFVVQTFRQRDVGDIVFLECSTAAGMVRLVLPPAVSTVIARQRDALTAKVRSKAARATAADRKARGLEPAFLKGRAKRRATRGR